MKGKKMQWLVLLGSVAALVLVVGYTINRVQAQAERQMVPPTPQETKRPDVSVISVSSGESSAVVKGYGEVRTHFELTLSAQVAGQVTELSDTFETGSKVSKGDVLLRLEDSSYRAAFATAESELAQAQLELLEEERQSQQAVAEWQSSGMKGEPDSELVLRRPHLAVAQANVVKAKESLACAKKDLERTRITAPFNGLVVKRSVSPGSYLQVGAEVATFYSTDRVEVAVSLASEEWQNLPAHDDLVVNRWPVAVRAVENDKTWQGYILRTEQHLDETTRQRTLVVAVDKPFDQSPSLLPGQFVEVSLVGRSIDNLWKVPGSSMSQRGEVWYVQEDTLKKFAVDSLFTKEGFIFIKAPTDLAGSEVQVLTHPLNSYLAGMKVHPVEVKENE